MKKKTEYTDEPMMLGEIVEDLLPPPHVIAQWLKKKKITIELSEPATDFFKYQAREHGVSYQAMIRQVLDDYVRRERGLMASKEDKA
jgi:hypothetical protein